MKFVPTYKKMLNLLQSSLGRELDHLAFKTPKRNSINVLINDVYDDGNFYENIKLKYYTLESNQEELKYHFHLSFTLREIYPLGYAESDGVKPVSSRTDSCSYTIYSYEEFKYHTLPDFIERRKLFYLNSKRPHLIPNELIGRKLLASMRGFFRTLLDRVVNFYKD